jgi:hypothetical protein
MKDASGSSLVTSWMLPKPKTEEQHNPEHSKTDDKTPSPTEVADSSQGAEEKPGNEQTLSPTDVADSPKTNPKAWFEYLVAYENADDDDDYDDGMATDEAAAIAEAMAEAAALNTTLHCHIGAKRQHEDDAQPEVPQQVR